MTLMGLCWVALVAVGGLVALWALGLIGKR
jgi:hypothetical protein